MQQADSNHDDISKTRRKIAMNDLQDLGMELTRLSDETLKKMVLPENLYEAVRSYRKISSNGALKRQAQYIGRLMRETDPEPIRESLAKMRGENAAHNAFLQRVERMREQLLENDEALTAFITQYPAADAGTIRTLIRNTRKERSLNKPPKNFRALYQTLKEAMNPATGLTKTATE